MATNYYPTTSDCQSISYTEATWHNWASGTAGTSLSRTVPVTGTGITVSDTTWYNWTDQYQSLIPTICSPIAETAEEKANREQREKTHREEAARLQAIADAAEKEKEKKARQLLREVLSKEQDKELDDKGFFELVSVKSGCRYRINKGRSGNVQQLDDKTGRVLKKLCFHPADYVHHYDTMAIQKLMLENDEEQVRKVANFS